MNESEYRFWIILKSQIEYLFANDPRYAIVREKNLPSDFAKKLMDGLLDYSADNRGQAVVNTCKALGIKPTYKAIKQFLKGS